MACRSNLRFCGGVGACVGGAGLGVGGSGTGGRGGGWWERPPRNGEALAAEPSKLR